jgi:hypothetical protein
MGNKNDKRINLYYKLDEQGCYIINISIMSIRTIKNKNGARLSINYIYNTLDKPMYDQLDLGYPTMQEANRIASYVYNSLANGHEIANIYQMQQHYESGKDY